MPMGFMAFDDYESVLPNTVNIGGKEYPLTYRSDREELEQGSWYKEWLRYVLQNHTVAIDRSTGLPVIFDAGYKAVLYDSFLVLQFEGLSNSGKSWLAFAKAFELLDLWELVDVYGELHIVQSWSKVLRMVSSAEKGDVIFCDEETTTTGQESKQDSMALSNILRACRVKGVSFFFLDPNPTPKDNVDFKIKIVCQAKGAFYTFSLVYTPKEKLLGWDDTKIPIGVLSSPKVITNCGKNPTVITTWEEFFAYYKPLKDAHVENLLDDEGIMSSGVRERQIGHAKQLYEHACEQGVKITKQRLDTWIVDLKLEGLTKDYKNQVIQRVMDTVESSGRKVRSVGTDEDFRVKWLIEETTNEPLVEGFHEKLLPFLRKMAIKFNKEQKKKKNARTIKPEHCEWFVRWAKGEPQAQIGADYEKSQAQVSIAVGEVRQSVLGYAVEEWLHKAHPEWKFVGGNTDEPDFETPTTVISVKARCRDNIQIEYKDFGKKERERCVKDGKQLFMYYFELKYHKRFIVFEAKVQEA